MPITDIGGTGAEKRTLSIAPAHMNSRLAFRIKEHDGNFSKGDVALSSPQIAELVNLLLAHPGVEATLEAR